jgi:hypothetical protein
MSDTDTNVEQAAPVKRGPGRPPKNDPSKAEQVTYLPGPEDPTMVVWRGHHFYANVPKTVMNPDLIEQAKGNKFFKVGDFNPNSDSVATREETPLPKNSEQYRVWFAAWLKTMKSAEALDQRWIAEEVLREQCEVGSDDIDFMNSLYQPKRAELRKASMPG